MLIIFLKIKKNFHDGENQGIRKSSNTSTPILVFCTIYNAMPVSKLFLENPVLKNMSICTKVRCRWTQKPNN